MKPTIFKYRQIAATKITIDKNFNKSYSISLQTSEMHGEERIPEGFESLFFAGRPFRFTSEIMRDFRFAWIKD